MPNDTAVGLPCTPAGGAAPAQRRWVRPCAVACSWRARPAASGRPGRVCPFGGPEPHRETDPTSTHLPCCRLPLALLVQPPLLLQLLLVDKQQLLLLHRVRLEVRRGGGVKTTDHCLPPRLIVHCSR